MNLADALVATFARYGRSLSVADLELWLEDLAELPATDAVAALRAHRLDPDVGKFPPLPADIVKRIQGSHEERAMLAWSQVRQAVQRIGHYQPVCFGSPLVHGVIVEMGGWGKLCEMKTDEAAFRQAEFVKRFVTYSSRGATPPAAPEFLSGEHEGLPVNVLAYLSARPAAIAATPRQTALPAATPEQIATAKRDWVGGRRPALRSAP